MGKKGGKRDPVERARRKLAEAQSALQTARDERTRVKLKGEQAVERARRRSAQHLNKATRRVEQRSSDVDRAQRELAILKDAERAVAASEGTTVSGPMMVVPEDEPEAEMEKE